jgi:hypothetical protein
MARKRFSQEKIITMLRAAVALHYQVTPVGEVCRNLGISEQTTPPCHSRVTKMRKPA